MSHEIFEVTLSKKGRGKGFSLTRPWTIRTFKLKGQTLEYWDRETMKGTVDLKGSATSIIPDAEADGREFAFAITTTNEKVILSASSNAIREKCIETFNTASNDPDWAKRKAAVTKEQEDYDRAAKAAVAAAFAEEAEKARLQKELENLENQRKEEVSAGAASVFQENLADKALEDARKAEEEQKAQQVSTTHTLTVCPVINLLSLVNSKLKSWVCLDKRMRSEDSERPSPRDIRKSPAMLPPICSKVHGDRSWLPVK